MTRKNQVNFSSAIFVKKSEHLVPSALNAQYNKSVVSHHNVFSQPIFHARLTEEKMERIFRTEHCQSQTGIPIKSTTGKIV